MNDQNELRMTQDRELVNLKDFDEQVGGLIKIFPYRALYGKKEKTLFQDGATTIVRISQNGVPNYYHLKFDWDEEKGEAISEHRYFEAYYMEDVATKTAIRPDTTAFTKDTRRVRTIKVITDTYIQSNDYKIDFYTIGEPFDREKAQKGEQIIYYGTDFTFEVPALAEKKIRSDFDIDISTPLTSFVLQDITMQEEQFGDAKLVFWDKDIPLDDVESMALEVTPDIILDRVLVKGITTENGLRELTDIDFTTSTTEAQTIPFMVTPISTEQKVEIDTPWFDNRKTLDLFHIRDIMSGSDSGGILFSQIAKRWGFDDALKEVILDMVLLTYEYQINFSNIELESNGAPKQDITMGYGNWKPGPLMTSGALHGVSAVWKKWEKIHASSSTRIDSNQYKLAQAFIAAFSKNIISEFSVAGGGNDFNKNILPWRLLLAKPLDITVDDSTSHYKLSDFWIVVDKSNPFFDFKIEKNGEQIWTGRYLKTGKLKVTKTTNKWFYTLSGEHSYDDAINKGKHDFSNGPLVIYIGGK